MQGKGATVVVQNHTLRAELRQAIRDLTDRGMKRSAAWAAELLAGLGTMDLSLNMGDSSKSAGSVDAHEKSMKTTHDDTSDSWAATITSSGRDTDTLLVAKTYFDLGEYNRCAFTLSRDETMPKTGNMKETFLWGFATYLAGEKRKTEELTEVADPLEKSQLKNSNIMNLYNEFSSLRESCELDGFNLYLFGLVLKQMNNDTLALDFMCQSVRAYPLNWSAWLDLASLCPDQQTLEQLSLPSHWVTFLFRAHMMLEFQQCEDAEEMYSNLIPVFPTSSYVLAQQAMAQYDLRNFDEAQETFQIVVKQDPYRLLNMDTYSNILYVKESKSELSYLAHSAVRSNKYRAETCCIIGNYYSLKAQHERAVLYFKRALRLNHNYLSAWTLMGHEFVEMKNPPAAIEAYRSAVNVSPRDYRAWYGLGQTYELLQMYFYALHYFRKATTLRPYDPRMWCALGGCYEKLGRTNEAVKCYQRAECHNDREGIAVQHLAKLYADQLQNRAQAAYYYNKHLERRIQENAMGGPDTVEALKYLATYLRDTGNLQQAERYCLRLMDCSGPEKKEAEAMLREIHQLQAAGSTN